MISVILCTYNRAESLRAALSSLWEMTVPTRIEWELLVVDNNSKDHTKQVVDEYRQSSPCPVRYLYEARQGKSFALNAGVQAARGEILVFTDDDVTFAETWLTEIYNAFERDKCDAVGGKIVSVWGLPKPSWLATEGPYRPMAVIVEFDHGEEPCPLRVPPFGANMAIRKVVFDKNGLFRTDLGPTAGKLMRGEDTELCGRLLREGGVIQYAPKAIVYHPVELCRTKKQYFLSWYFDYGRSAFVRDGMPDGTHCYWGIPRFLVRMLVVRLLRWLTAINEQERFYHKLQTYEIAGLIAQAHSTKARH